MKERRHSIALIEDDPADAEMLRVALQETGAAIDVTVFPGGSEALDYLERNRSGRNTFDLVILDLNLPCMSGFEVLERFRSDEHLKGMPVVIMSGSKNPEEIARCYALGANSYLAKPGHLPEILATVDQLVRYWFTCAQLP